MPSDRSRRNVLLLALSQACTMIVMSTMLAEAALVGEMLAPDKALATLPLALQQVVVMATAIPAALLMRRYGRRLGFSIGAGFAIAGSTIAMLGTLQGSFTLFCLGTAINGGYNGFATYYRFAAVEGASPQWKSRAISYVLAGGVLAAVIGPELAKLTKDMLAPVAFAGSFGGLIGVSIVGLIILQFIDIPRPVLNVAATAGRPLMEIVRQPRFLVALIGASIGYAVMSFVMTATPLAMLGCGFAFEATASVIQLHIFAMFAPSFFTGHVIERFGTLRVMASGAVLLLACVAINLAGIALWNFTLALILLGLGWNFLFVGGTALLTESYRPEERAKVQALNDFLIFGLLAGVVTLSGVIEQRLGWAAVNLAALPLVVFVIAAVLWLALRRQPVAARIDQPGGVGA